MKTELDGKQSEGGTDLGIERLKFLVSHPHGNVHQTVGCMFQGLRALSRDGDLDLRANSKLTTVEITIDMISQKSGNPALG